MMDDYLKSYVVKWVWQNGFCHSLDSSPTDEISVISNCKHLHFKYGSNDDEILDWTILKRFCR